MNSDIRLIKRMLQLTSPKKTRLWGSLALYLPVTALALLQPFLIGVAVERGFLTKDFAQITLWAAVYFGVVCMHSATEMLQLDWLQHVGQELVHGLRRHVFNKTLALPISYFDKTPIGKLISRVMGDSEAVSELFASGSVALLGDILFIIGTLIMLFFVDVPLSFGALVMMPFLAAFVHFFRIQMRRAYHLVRAELAVLNGYLQEHLSGMSTVQLFGQSRRVKRELAKVNMAYMDANRHAILLDVTIYSTVDMFSTITIAVVLWWSGFVLQHGMMHLGILVVFVEALNRFFQPIRELSNRYTVVASALVSLERVCDLLDEPDERGLLGRTDVHFNRELRFDDVSFSYETGSAVLRHVSLCLEKGKKIALVGKTGSGKSTITRLATRLYETSQGKITLDGTDIRDYNVHAFRRLFNIVPQDVSLFSGSLRDNLVYGKDDATDELVLHALEMCQASYLLDKLGGLQGSLDARGSNLSLGERQLVALTRALIANPQILILDEATASIDPLTERRLQIATQTLLKDRTAIIVAHRLSTIQDCDEIIVCHQGQIAERGNHTSLMAQHGLYARLVELQQQGAQEA